MAMTNNLFSELSPNTISHSATSALLVTDPSFHDWAVVMCELSAPTAAKYVEATTKWPNSVAINETAYNIAFDTDLPFFDHLALDPEKTKQFAGYMKNVTSSQGTSMEHLLRGFPWASLGEATVVDVCNILDFALMS
jgi:6-hydroxytryprostatin B O-methyltransferase